jgi:hypothetical protein
MEDHLLSQSAGRDATHNCLAGSEEVFAYEGMLAAVT